MVCLEVIAVEPHPNVNWNMWVMVLPPLCLLRSHPLSSAAGDGQVETLDVERQPGISCWGRRLVLVLSFSYPLGGFSLPYNPPIH